MPKKTDLEKLDKACLLYQSGMSSYEVVDLTGVSRPVLYRQLKKRGIKNQTQLKGNKRIYQCKDNAFDVPSEERDYWIGMMMADGCLYKSKSSFVIELGLKKSDVAHIYKFRNFLQAENPVHFKQSMAALVIRSPQLYKALIQFGVVPNKTFTAKVLHLENSRHFWRGVIDGDGSLFTHTVKNRLKTREYKLPAISLVGSKPLLTQFWAFASPIIPNCKVSILKKGNINSIRINSALSIIDILYNNCSIVLSRKKITAEKLLN